MKAKSVPSQETGSGMPDAALQQMPGHCIRRLQQIASALFMQETSTQAVTSVQFAVLFAISRQPGMDQRSLSKTVSFDTSTIGGVIDRLEARGLLTRNLSPEDRRVRLLQLTDAGEQMLETLMAPVHQVQLRILEALAPEEREPFLRNMQRIIDYHDPRITSG